MSQTINIYYTEENGNARKFAEEIILKGIVDRVRQEEGNEKYNYFYPIDDQQRFYSYLRFYSYNDLLTQMKAYLKRSNNIPMQILNWMTPIEKRKQLKKQC